jgi:hypothetical protein
MHGLPDGVRAQSCANPSVLTSPCARYCRRVARSRRVRSLWRAPSQYKCLSVPFAQNFVSVPHAMYFALVSVTTVGFGDITANTWGGRERSRTLSTARAQFCSLRIHKQRRVG